MGILIQHHVLRVISVPEVDPEEAAEGSRALCASAKMLARINDVAGETDTDPTQAQREAGNYRHGKFGWNGLTISVENPKGSTRSGVDKDGKEWSIKMKHLYGYILGTEGRDKDHIDITLRDDNPHSELVFVVNQIDPKTGDFDEHKVIAGTVNEEEARKTYLDNYEDGWKGLGSIYPLTMPQFKWWLEHADTTRRIEDGMFAKYRRKAAEDERLYKYGFANDPAGVLQTAGAEGGPGVTGVIGRTGRIEKDAGGSSGGTPAGTRDDKGAMGGDADPAEREGEDVPGSTGRRHTSARNESSDHCSARAKDGEYTFLDFPDYFAEFGPEHRFDVNYGGRNVGTVSIMDKPYNERRWVRGLYVSPRHRGKGLARQLLQKLVDKFGHLPMELHASPFKDKPLNAEQLTKLYESFGFADGDSGCLERPANDNSKKPVIDTGHDVPYLGGTNIKGNVVYIDHSMPEHIPVDGKSCDAWKYITVHETTEKPLMDGGEEYQTAHRYATAAEKKSVEADGINWKAYCEALKPYITRAEEQRDTDVPGDLNPQPYRDSSEPDPRKHPEPAASDAGHDSTAVSEQDGERESGPIPDTQAAAVQEEERTRESTSPRRDRREQPQDGRDDGDDSLLATRRPAGDGEGVRGGADPHGPGPVRREHGKAGEDQHGKRQRSVDFRDEQLLIPVPDKPDGEFQAMWDKIAGVFEKAAADDHVPTLCVDLDGTLAEDYETFDPDVIGKPRPGAKKWMDKFREAGARLIVWTVRGNTQLVKDWLKEHEITHDYVNENPDQPAGSSEKLIADCYIDDRAVDGSKPWSRFGPEIIDLLQETK